MARPRLDSLDLLRGIVMVLMALDHVRDYFGPQFVDGQMATPEMIAGVGPGWFATRWVTHFCAPVFVLTAGMSIDLFQSRGRTRAEVSRFLLTRGLWLIALELTIVHLGWFLTDPYRVVFFQVIWAIGASMVVMAGLIWLPRWAVGVIGAGIIAGHGLLPAEVVAAGDPSLLVVSAQRAWMLLVSGGAFALVIDDGVPVRFVAVNYPLLAWLGVMACGYALGPVLRLEPARRVRWLMGLGAACTIGFIVLRFVDVYGDPAHWRTLEAGAGAIPDDGVRSSVDTVIAFLNCAKYPPSLLFLMMTLGPALLALGCFDVILRGTRRGPLAGCLVTFGRVPLFFYVLHLYVIQVLVGTWALSRFGWEATNWGFFNPPPPEFTRYGLWAVYGAWLATVALTYPACRWFAGVKQRHSGWWVSYM